MSISYVVLCVITCCVLFIVLCATNSLFVILATVSVGVQLLQLLCLSLLKFPWSAPPFLGELHVQRFVVVNAQMWTLVLIFVVLLMIVCVTPSVGSVMASFRV